METPSKFEIHKNNSHTDYVTMVGVCWYCWYGVHYYYSGMFINCVCCFNLQYPSPDLSFCPINADCNTLPASCIKCNLNISCTYGKELTVTCDALPTVQCNVSCGYAIGIHTMLKLWFSIIAAEEYPVMCNSKNYARSWWTTTDTTGFESNTVNY